MDRNIRRALYTALVAGGLMVVVAPAADATEARPQPAAQEVTGSIEGSAAARGDLGAVVDTPEPQVAGTADVGLVGDVVGPDGILGSLAKGDVGGVVDGALGEDGLVDDLLGGLPQPDEPGTDEPGTDEPGTDEPGTDEPGTDEPGTDEPGTDEPGTDKPGTDEPGTDKPGTDKPGTDEPGTDEPASEASRPDSDRPGSGSATIEPEAAHRGEETTAGVALTGAFLGGLGGSNTDRDGRYPGTSGADDSKDHAEERDADRELPDGGVDISWGDKADPVPATEYDGSILTGDSGEGLLGMVPEPEPEPAGEVEAKPVVVPGDASVRTGHMFTGQLSLISLLLGLGIAVLRMRRR